MQNREETVNNTLIGKDPFINLPTEVLAKIFSNLSPSNVNSILLTNKNFNATVKSKSFWMEKFELHFPHIFPLILKKFNIPFGPTKIIDIDWLTEFFITYKDKYKNLSQSARELIFIVKEGYYESCYDDKGKPIELEINLWDQIDEDNQSILFWAQQLCTQNKFRQLNDALLALELSYEYLAKELKDEHIAQELSSLREIRKLFYSKNMNRELNYQSILDYFYQLEKKFYSDDTTEDKLIINTRKKDNEDRNLLYHAFTCNQSEAEIVFLLSVGSELDGMRERINGYHPIHVACQLGRLDLVVLLIEKSEGFLNEPDSKGRTPLMIAAIYGHLPIASYLLSKKDAIKLEPVTCHLSGIEDGKNALHLAVENGHSEIVKLLLHAGMDVTTTAGDMTFTPLHYAARAGKVDIVQMLVEIVAKKDPIQLKDYVNKPDSHGQTSLLWASTKNNLEVLEYLLNLVELKGNKPEKIVNLDSGTRGFDSSHDRKTALDWAIQNKNIAVMIALLKAGSNITGSFGSLNRVPIHLAVTTNNLQAVKILIEYQPELLYLADANGHTPFMLAVEKGDLPIIELLLSKDKESFNTSLLSKDYKGLTALHLAADKGLSDIVDFLFEAGANPTIKMNDGVESQSIHLAVLGNHLASVKAHIEHYPKLINQTDFLGHTPLMLAAEKGYFDIVIYLVSIDGIDLNSKTHDLSKTALHLAAARGFNEIVNILLQYDARWSLDKPIDKSRLTRDVREEIERREHIIKKIERHEHIMKEIERRGEYMMKEGSERRGGYMMKHGNYPFFSFAQTSFGSNLKTNDASPQNPLVNNHEQSDNVNEKVSRRFS